MDWMNNYNKNGMNFPNMNSNPGNYQTPAMGNVWNRMQQQQNFSLPHYESPLIHGRTEAENFLMGPNSSIFLPDADNNIIWWIRTDGAGTKSVDPFDIDPHKEPQPIDINTIEARLAAVEEWMHAKSNKSNATRRNNNTNANANVASSSAGEITE